MLKLPYPRGPHLAQLVEQGQPRFDFPRPMTNRPGLDFSFSGLKTAVLTAVREQQNTQGALEPSVRADIAASFQAAVVETLSIKCLRALRQTHCKTLVLAGG